MSETLLEKTRKLNKILQKSGGDFLKFSDLSTVLSKILESNVYVVSRRGKILGYSLYDKNSGYAAEANILENMCFSREYNRALLRIMETKENIRGEELPEEELKKAIRDTVDRFITIVPVNCGGDRLGTLIFESFGKKFTEDDLVLAEYSATIVGIEIMRAKAEEAEKEARKKAMVQMALNTLSYSELEAAEHIFNELEGNEGLVVASKIADRAKITRSVVVNALRKLESAGVIEARSLGMKGTRIKILNDKLLEELEKVK